MRVEKAIISVPKIVGKKLEIDDGGELEEMMVIIRTSELVAVRSCELLVVVCSDNVVRMRDGIMECQWSGLAEVFAKPGQSGCVPSRW